MATPPAAQTVTTTPAIYTATVDGGRWWKFTIPQHVREILISYSAVFRDSFDIHWSFDSSLSHNGSATTAGSYASDGTIYNQGTRYYRDTASTERRAFVIPVDPIGRNDGPISFYFAASEDECFTLCFGG